VAAVCRLSSTEEQYLLSQIPISERDHRITNRLNFVDAATHKQKTMPVAFPPRFVIKDEFDSVTDKSALSPASDSFFSKFTAVSYKRPQELVGTQTINALNKWIENGFNLSGGKDELGFLFFYELMTSSLPIKILPSDDPHLLGSMLIRFLPAKEHQEQNLLLSILRILALNPAVARNFSVPKVQANKGVMNMFFKGLDNIFSRLIKQVQPWLMKLEKELQWPYFGKTFIPSNTATINIEVSYDTFTRFLAVPRVTNYSCKQRELRESISFNIGGVTIGTSKSDVRAFATWPLSPLTIQNYVSMQNRQQQGLPEIDPSLPFDVASYVKTHVSKSMADRMQKDAAAYAEKENKGASSKLKMFTKSEIMGYVANPNSDALTKAITQVETLLTAMMNAHQADIKYITIAIENVVKAANFVPGISSKNPNSGLDEGQILSRLAFALQRVSLREPKIWFEFM